MTTTHQYGGFWIRTAATLIDFLLLAMIIVPILLIFHQPAELINHQPKALADLILMNGIPIAATIVFWLYRAATPGKILFDLKIIDCRTCKQPGVQQLFIRYFAYFISAMPLFLGFIWVAFDPKKQAWHDKFAGTTVVVNQKISNTAHQRVPWLQYFVKIYRPAQIPSI